MKERVPLEIVFNYPGPVGLVIEGERRLLVNVVSDSVRMQVILLERSIFPQCLPSTYNGFPTVFAISE